MKTKSFKLDLFPLIAMGCALVAIIMFCLPFIAGKIEGITTTTFSVSGFAAAFGGKWSSVTGSVSVEYDGKLVAVDLIAFILIVVGLLTAAFNFFIECKFEKIIAFVSMGALVAAAILLFISAANFAPLYEGTLIQEIAKKGALGAGAIIAAILAIAGAACEAIKMFKK